MILLDANILLEMLIAGRPRKQIVFDWMVRNDESYCISMLTVDLVLHFAVKDNLKLADIKKFLADYPKIALLPEDYVSAMELLIGKDHEDALQLAIAIRNKCSKIVTLDLDFARKYKDKFEFSTLGG
jgi:predicted nucleic acid-binding protein